MTTSQVAKVRAMAEDQAAERFLGQQREYSDGMLLSTPQSIERAHALLASMQENAEHVILERIQAADYFACESLDRHELQTVSEALGTLPAASKHHFFTSTWSSLGTTPLEALRAGRLAEVLTAAV